MRVRFVCRALIFLFWEDVDIMTITPILENYLEAIYLKSNNGYSVRVTDMANQLGISKSGVNRAVNSLCALGLVEHRTYGGIKITAEGRHYAKKMIYKKELVTRFFMHTLDLSEQDARAEAECIEHTVGEKTVDKIAAYLNA